MAPAPLATDASTSSDEAKAGVEASPKPDLEVSVVDDTCFETYLQRLESIQWESSSSKVAVVLGEMLSSVNNLSTELEEKFDAESPDSGVHMGLQQEIQSELNEISEIFQEFAERHPSITQDQAAAAAIFEQLQSPGGASRKPARR